VGEQATEVDIRRLAGPHASADVRLALRLSAVVVRDSTVPRAATQVGGAAIWKGEASMVSQNTASRSSEGAGVVAPAGQGRESLHEKAGQVVDQAQDKAGQLVDGAKQQAASRLAGQKDQAADTLYTVAHVLRQAGQQLREQDQGPVATLADRAAQQAEHGSGYLRGRDIPQLLDETEQLGRTHPVLFASGALALGLLGVRFLRSSRRTPQASPDAPLQLPPPTTPVPRTPPPTSDRALGDTDAARGSGVGAGASTAPRSPADHAPVVMSGVEVTSAYTPHETGFQAVEDVVQQMHDADAQ